MARSIKLIALAAAIAALVIAGTRLPIVRWSIEVVEAIHHLGALGWAIFVAAFAIVTITLVPASILTLGAGFVYGLAGVALVFPGALIGALAAFAVGRWLGRGWVADRLSNARRFQAIDDVIGDRGFAVTALLRLSPLMPFGLLNYGLSLTRISLRDYTLATALGIVPGMLLYVYLGSSINNLAALADHASPDSTAVQIAFWTGLAVTLAATAWITHLARRRLSATLPDERPT